MKILLHKAATEDCECDLLISLVFKAKAIQQKSTNKSRKTGLFEIDAVVKKLDKQVDGFLISGAQDESFIGDESQVFLTNTLGRAQAKSLALLGLGLAHEQSVDLFRRTGGECLKLAQKKRATKLAIGIPEEITVPLFDVVQAMVEGIRLASYQFDRYQTKDKKTNPVKEINIHLPAVPVASHKHAVSRGDIITEGVMLARDLINEGPLELNPAKMAEHAHKVAEQSGLDIEVLDEKRLKKERMGLMLAVGSASHSVSPPRLIKLHYKPKKKSSRTIVLVGKGVTFDSGGLDIKTADGMLDMKVDMSGAAAVLGIMSAIGKLAPKVEVKGYLACVENGVGPEAYHPGDILISRKGLSVEINNTDAEGRLVLADAFTYAIDTDKPDTIIDLATLTGACMIALGPKTAGLFSNDDALADAILASATMAGEAYWRMPLTASLKEGLKSPVADLKNCGERYGGAITAALFLEHFIDKSIKWAHLDIAGPATNNKPHAYQSIGGVGFGIRTLVDYLMAQ